MVIIRCYKIVLWRLLCLLLIMCNRMLQYNIKKECNVAQSVRLTHCSYAHLVRRGADKSLAFPISYFPVCSTTKIIFLGWVKEVRTTKS
jgi:hypothetical protein